MKTWAVTRFTIQQTLHQKIFYVITMLIVLASLTTLTLPSVDLDNARLKLMTNLILGVIATLGTTLAVILPALSIPSEIHRKEILAVVTKPVRRISYLFGHFLGLAIVLTLVVMLLGLAGLAMTLYVNHLAPASSLQARKPQYSADRARENWRATPVHTHVWQFAQTDPRAFSGDAITARIKLMIITGSQGDLKAPFLVEIPGKHTTWSKEIRLKQDVEATLTFPKKHFQASQSIKITGKEEAYRFLPDPKGVAIFRDPEPFAFTFFKALFLTLCEVMLVLAAVTAGSAMLSTPVSVFWGLSFAIFGNLVDFVNDAVITFYRFRPQRTDLLLEEHFGHHLHRPGAFEAFINDAAHHFAGLFCKVCPDFTKYFSAGVYLDNSLAVPWAAVGQGLVYALMYIALFLLLGTWAFHTRELA